VPQYVERESGVRHPGPRHCPGALWAVRARLRDCVFLQGAGVRPSCNARRMAATAAHLADHVFPRLPVRAPWPASTRSRSSTASGRRSEPTCTSGPRRESRGRQLFRQRSLPFSEQSPPAHARGATALCEVAGNVPAGNRRPNREGRLSLPATGGEGQGLGGYAQFRVTPANPLRCKKGAAQSLNENWTRSRASLRPNAAHAHYAEDDTPGYRPSR